MSTEPVTVRGLELMKAELVQLKNSERPQVIAAIAEARAHGDLKENAEYHAAKEQQGFIEGRIGELEARLSRAKFIDLQTLDACGLVVFGTTITLLNLDTDEESRYQIVGVDEADIKQGLLSYQAPLARTLIGKEEGAVVEVSAPGGVVEYEIVAVSYL